VRLDLFRMPVLLLARRQLRSHGARAALTAAGIACGVALVVAIEVINASTLGAFTEAIDDLAGTASLQVRGRGDFPEDVAERLRDLPGIEHAVPILTDTFFVVGGPAANEALSVFAADVTDGHAIKTLRLVRSGDSVVDDPLSFLVDPASVILTDVFARRVDAHVGSTLQLRTPVGVRTFTVRGILPPGGVGRAFGGNLLLMDVIGAQTVLGREGKIDQVDIVLAPGSTSTRASAPSAPCCRRESTCSGRHAGGSRSSASCARTGRCSRASRGWRSSPRSSWWRARSPRASRRGGSRSGCFAASGRPGGRCSGSSWARLRYSAPSAPVSGSSSDWSSLASCWTP